MKSIVSKFCSPSDWLHCKPEGGEPLSGLLKKESIAAEHGVGSQSQRLVVQGQPGLHIETTGKKTSETEQGTQK